MGIARRIHCQSVPVFIRQLIIPRVAPGEPQMTVNDVVLRPRSVVLDVWRAILRVVVRIQIDIIAANLLAGHAVHQPLSRIGNRRIPIIFLRDRLKFRLDPFRADNPRLPSKAATIDLIVAVVADPGRKGNALPDDVTAGITINVLARILRRAAVRRVADQRRAGMPRRAGKRHDGIPRQQISPCVLHCRRAVIGFIEGCPRHCRHDLSPRDGARRRLGEL